MVSFWPFKGKENSASSFEKTLSDLTARISSYNAKRDALASSGRRYKALWTLYSGFIYTIYAMIMFLVSGRSTWGVPEYTVISGGPVIIYLARAGLAAFYDYRISTTQAHLDSLNTQKEAAIEKFKEATKYNSTQQLLEKYGAGSLSSPKDRPESGDSSKLQTPKNTPKRSMPSRTSLPIPPTANIQRASADAYGVVGTGEPVQGSGSMSDVTVTNAHHDQQLMAQPFDESLLRADKRTIQPSAPQYSGREHPQWYDRLMDLLLGEDETRAANRLALICSSCRLVNGQAAPGVRTLTEVGKWRCSGCGAWNGEDMEAETIIKEAKSNAGLRLENANETHSDSESTSKEKP